MSITTSAVFWGRRSPLYGQGYGSAAMKCPAVLASSGIFALLHRLRLILARRRREPAARAVDDGDFALPGQAIASCHHVVHERVWAVARAALHRHIAAVAEL